MGKNEQTVEKFTIAGTSISPKEVLTFRFANGKLNKRVNMLNHKGHTEVNLFELPRPMTQKNAMVWVLENVKGSKGAVLATRAADPEAKSDVVVAAEELVAKRRSAARAARKAEKIAA